MSWERRDYDDKVILLFVNNVFRDSVSRQFVCPSNQSKKWLKEGMPISFLEDLRKWWSQGVLLTLPNCTHEEKNGLRGMEWCKKCGITTVGSGDE